MPKARVKAQIVPKRQPTKAEAIATRKRIIEYYETTANRSKKITRAHFRNEVNRGTLYRIIQIYETRKKEGWKGKTKKVGMKSKIATPANLKRYEELHRMDPGLSTVEAAEILNMTRWQVVKLRKVFKKSLNDKNQESEEEDEDALDSWGLGKNRIIADPECHGHDNEPPPKMKKGRRCHCLACFQLFEEPPQELGNHHNKLNNNLKMIFAFKIVLDMSSEDMLEIMKLSRGRDPTDWVNFCEKCEAVLEKAMVIQSQIRKLGEKLNECKSEIAESIWETSGLRFKSNAKGASSVKSVVVTKRIREMIWNRDRNPPATNPFEEGDKEAESKALALLPPVETEPEIVVKQEVEEVEEPAPVDHLVELSLSEGPPKCEADFPPNDNLEDLPTVKQSVPQGISKETGETEELERPSPLDYLPIENAAENSESTSLPASTQGICDLCGMEMRPLAIPMHKLMVHGIVMEGFTVKYCKKDGCKYKTLYDFHIRRHMNQHESKVSFPCGFCGKTFAHRNKLANHEEIHKNAETRPYVCELCGSSFAVRNYLYLHTRLSHQGRYFPSTNRKRPKNTNDEVS